MKQIVRVSLVTALVFANSILLLWAQEGTCRLLDPEAARRFLPDRVPMETESIQVDHKNSSALQFSNNSRIAIAVLLTSGLSNEMRQKYQFVYVSETRLRLDRTNLPAGVLGLSLEGAKDAPTRALVARDFSGAEVERIVLKLDPGAPEGTVSLTPREATSFEMHFGKYTVSGVQR